MTGIQAADGGLTPAEVRAAVLRASAHRPPLVLRTEPHALGKYSILSGVDWPILELHDLRTDSSWRARHRTVRLIQRRLKQELPTRQPPALVFDATEAWFATNVYRIARRLLPETPFIGLQHGVMEQTGPRFWLMARRIRSVLSAAEFRMTGWNRVGAGFGNLPFDLYVCYGRRDAQFIWRLHPRAAVVRSFRALHQLEQATAPAWVPDVLFLAQDLAPFGVNDGAIVYTRILTRLQTLARAQGWTVVVKPHPKAPLPVDLAAIAPDLVSRSTGAVLDLLDPARTVAISFNSTALLEAAFLGCPIVAIRLPTLAPKWYDMFDDPVPLEAFLTTWDGNAFSRVGVGVLD